VARLGGNGNLWLSEALGPDLIIQSYKNVTVQVSGGEGKPSGTGLVLDRSHIVTNRHVVEALVGHGVDGSIEIRPSFKPPEAAWITRKSRVYARLDVDVAIIEAELGDNEGIPALPGLAFRNPRWDDELRVFGYPFTLGFTEQPITVEHGHVVNPEVESPAIFGEPAHKVFLTSAIQRPGNSGGPIVAQDGRVIGIVIDHTRGANRASAGTTSANQEPEGDSEGHPTSAESSPFYRGIPAGEIVKAIEQLGITDLAILEDSV
jgi:S1-C subfamily serine protease